MQPLEELVNDAVESPPQLRIFFHKCFNPSYSAQMEVQISEIKELVVIFMSVNKA